MAKASKERGQRRNERGQALVETGLTLVILVPVILGIIEFGWMFFSLSLVTNAARDGARVAAALQNRGPCGDISDTTSIPPLVRSQLAGIVTVDGGCDCAAGVCVRQCVATSGGTETCTPPPGAIPCPTYTGTDLPMIKVTVAGHLTDLFGFFGGSTYPFCRSMDFRDEGR